MAEQLRKTQLAKDIYAMRKQTIERVFADAKEKHAMRYTHHRGLARLTQWVTLKFAAMNLKKLPLRLPPRYSSFFFSFFFPSFFSIRRDHALPCSLSRMYSRFYRLIAPFFRRSHRQTMEIAYNGSGARFCLRFGDSRQAPRKAESCGHAMPSPISNIQPGKHRKPPCSDGAAFCQAFSSRRGKAQGTKRQYAASSEPTEVLRLHSA